VNLNFDVGINSSLIFRYEMVSLGSGKIEKFYSIDTMTGSRSSGHGRIPRFADKVYKSLGTFELVREGSIGVITSVVVICCGNTNSATHQYSNDKSESRHTPEQLTIDCTEYCDV
jgi:hypothetical protein